MKADCHMHMILDGVEWKSAIARHAEKPDIPWIRGVLETYRQQGYTYLRDGKPVPYKSEFEKEKSGHMA